MRNIFINTICNIWFISLSSGAGLCCHHIAICTSKGDISSSAIFYLWRFISIAWCAGTSYTSSCHIGGLSYSSHFYLLRYVHSQWLWDSWLLAWAYSPIVYSPFGRRECPCSRRLPAVPKLLSIVILLYWYMGRNS